MTGKREDDKFLRKVIWFLGVAFLTSAGGWTWTVAVTQTQVNANSEAVKEIKELQKTMTHINNGVIKLVENSEVRNEMMRDERKQQEFIFGEQKRRLPIIKRVTRHMDDDSKHVSRYRVK